MTPPSWLVTGGTGFLGRPLVDLLHRERPGDRVILVGRTPPRDFAFPVEHRTADLGDPAGLARVVAEVRPDRVVHLAGRTPPSPPEALYQANVVGTLHLLDALRALGQATRVVLVGSAAELGPVPDADLPVGEDYPARPAIPYGLSKWLATQAGLAASPPLSVVAARVFNPIGPGMPASQAFGRFAAELAQGDGPTRIRVGGLDARRDFVDARDMARALILLADPAGIGGVVHVGTGTSRRVGEGLDALIAASGREVAVEVDDAATTGPTDSRADIRRLVAATGWAPTVSWEQSLQDLWDDALRRAGDRH